MVERYEVCSVDELPPGERKLIEVRDGGTSIGVFNVEGNYYALANVCPHQLAPLCEGQITGQTIADSVGDFKQIREGEIIQCPWHGWKFDITNGKSVFNPHEIRTRTYEAEVETKTESESSSSNACSTTLQGDPPPIDQYEVDIEDEVVVVYA